MNKLDKDTNFYKFKYKLQNLLRNDQLVGISLFSFVTMCVFAIILALGTGLMYAHSEDKFDRNIFNIGKDNYQKSYILYNADKYRETTIMSEDGEREIDLMYLTHRGEELSLDSNFVWTTKVSRVLFCIALILFCFQILALTLNSYKDSDGDKRTITCVNDNYYCFGAFIINFIALALLMFVYSSGTTFKSQVEEVYTAAVQAMDIPLAKDELYVSKLTTKQKFQLVNKYLKKMVYNKTPMMFDIKNKKYIPFDLKTIKNFSEVEMMFKDKKE